MIYGVFMLENSTTVSSYFDNFFVSQEKLHFECNFDLSYLIRAWEKVDTEKYPMLKPFQKEILKEWKKRKSLHGTHKDGSAFVGHEDFIKILPKILNQKGILNIGGKLQTVYDFAKKSNPNVKKISGRKIFPLNPSMNVSRLKKFI